MVERLQKALAKNGSMQLRGRMYEKVDDGREIREHLYTIVIANDDTGYAEYRMFSDDKCCLSKTSREVYSLLEDSMLLILSKTGVKILILEDESGIMRVEKQDVVGKLIIEDFKKDYSERYNKITKFIDRKKRFCSSEHFYPRVLKKEGKMSLNDAFRYLKDHPEEFYLNERPKIVDSDPVLSVSAPDITRKFGSKDKNSFEWIAVEIVLRSDLGIQDIRSYIRANFKMLNKKALIKINSSRNFQKYNVPIKYLVFESITNHGNCLLRMVYKKKCVEDIRADGQPAARHVSA